MYLDASKELQNCAYIFTEMCQIYRETGTNLS